MCWTWSLHQPMHTQMYATCSNANLHCNAHLTRKHMRTTCHNILPHCNAHTWPMFARQAALQKTPAPFAQESRGALCAAIATDEQQLVHVLCTDGADKLLLIHLLYTQASQARGGCRRGR